MQVQEATVSSLLARAVARLGPELRSEPELLLAHALGRSRAWLFAHASDAVAGDLQQQFERQIARREAGEPIAQILGSRGFWSLDLRITADVLIPRAETELLVDCVLAVLPRDVATRVADLGTGSGAIALAIASERPLVEVVAVDASEAALAVAGFNARALGLSARVNCVSGSWFDPLIDQRFYAIVSNPPYIAEDDPHLEQGDLRFEPRLALASGPDGLDAIREIVGGAAAHLLPGGWLLIEHGWNQGEAIRTLFANAGFEQIATHLDLEGRERVTCGRNRSIR